MRKKDEGARGFRRQMTVDGDWDRWKLAPKFPRNADEAIKIIVKGQKDRIGTPRSHFGESGIRRAADESSASARGPAEKHKWLRGL
jgi:hypothetical protein